jgi:hypothetical protein
MSAFLEMKNNIEIILVNYLYYLGILYRKCHLHLINKTNLIFTRGERKIKIDIERLSDEVMNGKKLLRCLGIYYTEKTI